jgi:ferredoxin
LHLLPSTFPVSDRLYLINSADSDSKKRYNHILISDNLYQWLFFCRADQYRKEKKMDITQILNLAILLPGLITGIVLGWFGLVSIRERESRAAWISGGLAIGAVVFAILSIYLTFQTKFAILITITIFSLVTLILFLLPIGKLPPDNPHPTHRVDERMIMFARHRLQPESPEYEEYYSLHPEHKIADDRNRARPGILSTRGKFANAPAFAATDAGFQITEALHALVEGKPGGNRYPLSPQGATDYLTTQARIYGAKEVGITRLEPYHIYSHIGRGPGEYGSLIDLDHSFAIAFTVEMDFHSMQSAPHAVTVFESAHQYVQAGKIAVQLAASIRALGYEARAHMDANYRVICPPIGRDAGLGEIGRISLLMTPKFGPRVRLGVVTTNLPLVSDKTTPDPAMIDFCTICKKCAENCPSKAIPFGPRVEEDGILRWKLDAEKCFAYWNEAGTDCGICMAVCPYSHPDHPLHNFIRWGNARSGLFRRMALKLDNLFYGRKPTRKPNPAWLPEN